MEDRYFNGNYEKTMVLYKLRKSIIDLREMSGTTNFEEAINKYKQLKGNAK